MKILFHLPLARGWMLENVIEPMIAKLAPHAEVHVIMSRRWIAERSQSPAARDLYTAADVQWHNVDLDHEASDRDASAEIRKIAGEIDPDHCLCRSADRTLPERLPGTVRYIMEASAPPFSLPTHYVALQRQIFDHALMPKLGSEQRLGLRAIIAPIWTAIEDARPAIPDWRTRFNLPSGRKIVAVPLEYDHPDNTFQVHRSIRPNAKLAERFAETIDDRLFFAMTDHPLNIQFLDQTDLKQIVAQHRNRLTLLSLSPERGETTSVLAQHCDGMIVGDSKSFAAAAFFGKPLLRISKFSTGNWLRAYEDIDSFGSDLAEEKAVVADREDAMVWFAYYLATQVFAPREDEVGGEELLQRIDGGIDEADWNDTFERVARYNPVGTTNTTAVKLAKA